MAPPGSPRPRQDQGDASLSKAKPPSPAAAVVALWLLRRSRCPVGIFVALRGWVFERPGLGVRLNQRQQALERLPAGLPIAGRRVESASGSLRTGRTQVSIQALGQIDWQTQALLAAHDVPLAVRTV